MDFEFGSWIFLVLVTLSLSVSVSAFLMVKKCRKELQEPLPKKMGGHPVLMRRPGIKRKPFIMTEEKEWMQEQKGN